MAEKPPKTWPETYTRFRVWCRKQHIIPDDDGQRQYINFLQNELCTMRGIVAEDNRIDSALNHVTDGDTEYTFHGRKRY